MVDCRNSAQRDQCNLVTFLMNQSRLLRAAKLDALEQKTERLSLQHETFSHNTRVQLKQVFEALRQLMAPPTEPSKRSIGFVTGDEKPKGKG